MKGLIKKKKVFNILKDQMVLLWVDSCWTFIFLKIWKFTIRKNNNFQVFFQNGKDIFTKSSNGIYEKVFQGHNNDIMTVIAEKEVERR